MSVTISKYFGTTVLRIQKSCTYYGDETLYVKSITLFK